MLKLLTWTLNRPSTSLFDSYYKLAPGEPWYSPNYILVNPDAPKAWSDRTRTFVEMLEKYPNKFYAIGMHEFGVAGDGTVFDLGYPSVMYSNGYYGPDVSKKVLNADENDIALPVPTSLRYFMFKYPEIRWSIQFLCTTNKSGDRVTPVLNNTNGAQDTFIHQARRIAELYLLRGFPIKDIEIDFEKTFTVNDEWNLFKNLLVRVKNEVCIPLGLGLRVNLFAMTGDFTPSYYVWHDYRTVASGVDMNGNQAVDEFQLMTYDFSWGGSAPGPSTPLWWLQKVLDHVKNVLPPEKTYIGNAGYGRRWSLGENRYGVTLDYKQLTLVQNGMYVHNDGKTAPDGRFYFRDQDFIPFCGFNDLDSDYQVTYLHVYDRFKLTKNGGANVVMIKDEQGNDISSVNRPSGANYVTSYSRRQYAQFTGVVGYATTPTATSGRAEKIGTVQMYNATGIPPLTCEKWITHDTIMVEDPKTGKLVPSKKLEDQAGTLTYRIPANGTYKLIAIVVFPFYDSATLDMTVNSSPARMSGLDLEWYPFIQKAHFYNCGTFTFNGEAVIEIGLTNGVHVCGFIVCQTFDHGLRGGQVDFPVSLYPMKRRGNKLADGTVEIVDAQYPDVMRIVGEVLRRPPRPAIIFEDIFSYYGDGLDLTRSTPYYPQTSNGGYTQGTWTVVDKENSLPYAYVDSRYLSSQLILEREFSTNIMCEVEMVVDPQDTNAVYGIRVMAQNPRQFGDGYLFVVDHSVGKVRLFWEENGTSTLEREVNMSEALKKGLGNRYNLRVYKVNGKLSFWINDKAYFDRITPRNSRTTGAYGPYANLCRAKVYKYNISSLDRFERMERMQVTIDGVTYTFGSVPRNVPTDEFGYLIYTGYPADLSQQIKLPGDDEIGSGNNSVEGTVLDTEITPETWSLDYKNVNLADVPSWQGKKTVRITFLDAGIWFKSLYIGDAQGMSVAYNADKIAFIRTSQMVSDYKCKGIALWTLGQEDPTIFTYLPDCR